ncbi:helix-turn-helix domain-containing protein [Saccharolobus shibatae]|uniref:HTH cro/C1-type domain-containing protein n=1 Tax=Saccharolobus shibatae TaxID=2286 RepID=A0A8F5GWY8_9CREN|nr:helix-turn-helix domain-containing protein [Saccharolobus shibatae]QXJ31922.1 hypothetical protein J5U21_01573 [Saccharolobus shibatae]
MGFGYWYAGIITKADVIKIVNLLVKKGLSKTEIAKRIGITRGALYQWIWDMVKDIDYENKVKLLDLFYEVDKTAAINFVEEILEEHIRLLETEKSENFTPRTVIQSVITPAVSPITISLSETNLKEVVLH